MFPEVGLTHSDRVLEEVRSYGWDNIDEDTLSPSDFLTRIAEYVVESAESFDLPFKDIDDDYIDAIAGNYNFYFYSNFRRRLVELIKDNYKDGYLEHEALRNDVENYCDSESVNLYTDFGEGKNKE